MCDVGYPLSEHGCIPDAGREQARESGFDVSFFLSESALFNTYDDNFFFDAICDVWVLEYWGEF